MVRQLVLKRTNRWFIVVRMTSPQGSAVVEVMRKASLDSWKKWRDHVAAGTADSAEALKAYDDARLAGKAWAAEVDARAETAEASSQRAA